MISDLNNELNLNDFSEEELEPEFNDSVQINNKKMKNFTLDARNEKEKSEDNINLIKNLAQQIENFLAGFDICAIKIPITDSMKYANELLVLHHQIEDLLLKINSQSLSEDIVNEYIYEKNLKQIMIFYALLQEKAQRIYQAVKNTNMNLVDNQNNEDLRFEREFVQKIGKSNQSELNSILYLLFKADTELILGHHEKAVVTLGEIKKNQKDLNGIAQMKYYEIWTYTNIELGNIQILDELKQEIEVILKSYNSRKDEQIFCYWIQGKIKHAQGFSKQALELINTISSDQKGIRAILFDVLILKSEIFLELSEPLKALEVLNEAQSFISGLENYSYKRFKILYLLAKASVMLHKEVEYDWYLNQAESIIKDHLSESYLAFAILMHFKGCVMTEKNNYQDAKIIFETTLTKLSDHQNSFIAAKIKAMLGIVYLNMKELAKCSNILKESLQIFEIETKNGHPAMISLYNTIGIFNNRMNNIEGASICFQKSIELGKIFGRDDNDEFAIASSNLGNIFTIQKLYDKALDCYSNTLKIVKKRSSNSDVKIGLALCQCAMTLESLEKFEEAEINFLDALDIFESLSGEAKIQPHVSSFYFNYANFLFNSQKQFLLSSHFFKKSLEIDEKIEGATSNQIADTNLYIGIAEFNLKNFKISSQYLEKSIELYESNTEFDYENILMALNYLSIIKEELNDFYDALNILKKSKKYASINPSISVIVTIMLRMASINEKLNNYFESISIAKEGLDLFTKISQSNEEIQNKQRIYQFLINISLKNYRFKDAIRYQQEEIHLLLSNNSPRDLIKKYELIRKANRELRRI